MYFRQKLRQKRTVESMISMPVTASTYGCNNDACDDTAKYEDSVDYAQASENNACTKFQQPSDPVAGAEGGIGSGDIEYENTNMYESLSPSDDKQQ